MGIQENIKELCKEKGISTHKLETESGIGRGNIGRWDTSSPTIEKVAKVADYLDTSIDSLVYGEDRPLIEADEDLRILFAISKKATPEKRKELVRIAQAIIGEE